jgi:hypothetical protein
MQVFKCGRSDSQADLLSNTAHIDRSAPSYTVSTVTALSSSMRRRSDKSARNKTITSHDRPSSNAIDLSLVTGYHTDHNECLKQEADLYRNATDGKTNLALADTDEPAVTSRPKSEHRDVSSGQYAFAYDNPFCTTEV